MTDTTQQLTFLAWCRPPISALVTAQQGGRTAAAAALTLTESDAAGTTIGTPQTHSLPFLIAGPADITGLQPGAIVRRYPPPGTTDHESNICPYIEVADPTLPWRYTPAPNPAGPNLHPWLVLLTGPVTELQIQDGHVTVPPPAQQGPQAVGNPADPYRYAHVQVDAVGHRTTRILSARTLQPGTDYLAVVVPAFDGNGAPSWHGTAPVTLPVYDSWQFRTAEPAGSFANLAAKLHPGDAPGTTGQAQLSYPRLPQPPQLTMHGALVVRQPHSAVTETALPQQVADDLARLRNTPPDERGRPVVALPRYGDPWPVPAPASTSTWGAALNGDPRYRGVAGLGLEVGIRRQEDLVADVLDNLGAVRESSQRIRHLALGVAVTRSLWQRRVPADKQTRLWLLGPALNRLVTATGMVGELATADDRTPARGTFSAAARRVLRAGPARTAAAPLTPTALLASTNRQPPPIPAETDGLPLDAAGLKAFDTARQKGTVDANRLAQAVTELAARTPEGDLREAAGRLSTAVQNAVRAGHPVPWGSVVSLLASSDTTAVAKRAARRAPGAAAGHDLDELGTKVAGPQGQADDADLTELLKAVGPLSLNDPPQQPLVLPSLAGGVSDAFDPTVARPPAAARVLDTINVKAGADGGVDPNAPLAPPEPCIGLDRPAWADLAAEFGDWLLPGATGLDADGVVALQSNAGFIDAYLVGLNTQLLGELRWRNIPIATGCTPIRRFWDRADTASGQRADDIIGVASWPAGSGLGDAAHQAPGATGQELVIVVRGELLLRYPTTLVYLRSALHPPATVADFDHDPDAGAARVLPGFHGRLGDDIVFFGFPDVAAPDVGQYWLVFEEPPAGYRFWNVNDQGGPPSTKTEGHTWAADALVHPVRVLIRGDKLIPQG